MAPTTSGGLWTERVLYKFGAVANDGNVPGNLLFRGGVLYGTTLQGGTADSGTVFKLVRQPGLWTETILYNFTDGSDGWGPRGGLIADSDGNLYGTAYAGGNKTTCVSGCGTIFELSPPTIAGNPWTESTLYAFSGPTDGMNPFAGLRSDRLGNLYGTTYYGGEYISTSGTVFELKPPAVSGGSWTLAVLHYFRGLAVGDGTNPSSALTWVNGVLYGTTYYGGQNRTIPRSGGTVFTVVP